MEQTIVSFAYLFDPPQRAALNYRYGPPITMEDEMRIYERLRGKDCEQSGIERKLIEAVVTDSLTQIDENAVPKILANRSNCGNSCSAQAEGR